MKILIAIIAFNEGENIRKTLKDLKSIGSDYDIVVIDNASSDHTVNICDEDGVDVIAHCVNTGGSAGTVMTYFLYAYENKYDILCQFDGDGQHIASELPKIIEPIAKGESDYVIGSRFIDNEGFQSYFFRRLGIKLFACLNSKIIGKSITDATSGFRAYGRNVMEFYAKYYKHEIYDTSQLLLLSHFAGARIKEVPIEMRERMHGVSEYNLLNSISFPFKGLVNIIGCLLQKRQIQHFIRTRNGNQD